MDLEDDDPTGSVDVVTVFVDAELKRVPGTGRRRGSRSRLRGGAHGRWQSSLVVAGAAKRFAGVRGGTAPDADVSGRFDRQRGLETRLLGGAGLADVDGASQVAAVRPGVGEDAGVVTDAGGLVAPGLLSSVRDYRRTLTWMWS